MSAAITLSNGIQVPEICMGSGILHKYSRAGKLNKAKYWIKNYLKNQSQFKKDYNFSKVISTAMENGISMFDTSRAYYGAERELGKALRSYPRADYRIVTKLRNADQYKGDIRAALEASLSAMDLEYVDIYLMHWPVTDLWIRNWKEMEKLYEEGLCRAIGVCNCNIHHLEELKREANVFPVIDEFECHPLLTQNELRAYCRENGIQVMAYTSTARMDERLRKTALVPIAKEHGKSVAQVILRWHQQIGNIPIFASSSPEHVAANARLADFTLSPEEIEQITKININSRLRYDPDNCDFRQL